MITFFNLGKMGRLGNQLFQYAALKSLAIKNGYDIAIPPPEYSECHGQSSLLNEFDLKCRYGVENGKIRYQYNEPDWRTFDRNFFNIPDYTDLNGYFQSTLYFKHCEEQIKKELMPHEKHLKKAQKYVDNIRVQGYEVVSVHLRRGDNTDAKHIRTPVDWAYVHMYDEGGIYDQYLEKALKQFGSNTIFLVFTGGARNEDNKEDIQWCRERFVGDNFVFSENGSTIEDFCRIMFCDHNILSHVSSFGWWAAYQNQNKGIRVAPQDYHPESPGFLREGFYPEEWIIV